MSRDTLNQALQIVKGFAEKKSSLPILSAVLLEHSEGMLTLTATDLEAAIRYRVYRGDSDEWRACVPVHKLADLIREQGGEPILRPGEYHKLVIETASGELEISGMDPSDFPVYCRPDNEEYQCLPVDTFMDLESLPKTASRDDSRYMLNTIKFQCQRPLLAMDTGLTRSRCAGFLRHGTS